jgi:hypothetical protein
MLEHSPSFNRWLAKTSKILRMVDDPIRILTVEHDGDEGLIV